MSIPIFYYLRLPGPPQAATYPLVLETWVATDVLNPCVLSCPPKEAQSPKVLLVGGTSSVIGHLSRVWQPGGDPRHRLYGQVQGS